VKQLHNTGKDRLPMAERQKIQEEEKDEVFFFSLVGVMVGGGGCGGL
jgi:hypothetical protein